MFCTAIGALLFVVVVSADFCDNWRDPEKIDEMGSTTLIEEFDGAKAAMSQKVEDLKSTFDAVATDCLAQCNQNIEAVAQLSKGLLSKGQGLLCKRKASELAAAAAIAKAIFDECIKGVLRRHAEYISDVALWMPHLQEDMAMASRSFERCRSTEDTECLQDAMKLAVDSSCSAMMTAMTEKMMKCTDDAVECMSNYEANAEEAKC